MDVNNTQHNFQIKQPTATVQTCELKLIGQADYCQNTITCMTKSWKRGQIHEWFTEMHTHPSNAKLRPFSMPTWMHSSWYCSDHGGSRVRSSGFQGVDKKYCVGGVGKMVGGVTQFIFFELEGSLIFQKPYWRGHPFFPLVKNNTSFQYLEYACHWTDKYLF